MTDLVVARLDAARTALVEARTASQVKAVMDAAAAAETFAKRQKLSEETIQHATSIKLDAERKLGEILRETPDAPKGWAARKSQGTDAEPKDEVPTLRELGIDKKTSARAQRLAGLPEETFEAVRAGKVTVQSAIQQANREEKLEAISAKNEALPDKRYAVIYCDPPWRYEHVRTESRAIENHYPTMDLDAICALPIADIAAEDCALFLWATSPKLAEALRVVESWGFTYRTCAIWDKKQIGMGYYFRQQHELLLVATRGDIPAPAVGAREASIYREARGLHSAKPVYYAHLIERMYPGLPRVELFNRGGRPGWDTWGNQADAA